MDSRLLRQLQRPELYAHPVTAFEVIETHISWVLLTGTYAYKFRKPVNLGFLDFSSLELRHRDCLEELRLNRRLADPLYLGLTRITATSDGPAVDGDGPVLEYAVRMVQFPQAQLLSQLEPAGGVTPAMIHALAQRLATFHQSLPPAPASSDWGTMSVLQEVIGQNFTQVRAHADDPALTIDLDALEVWSAAQLERLRPLLQRRRSAGAVRECHGDLHLGNIVLWHDQPLPFDCIEFTPRYRWVDTLNDLAFLLMDLEFRQRAPLARVLLDHYLAQRGDYTGVALLPLFKSYRAMVRAKVALLGEDPQRRALAQRYIQLASSYRQHSRAALCLMHGISGSGKSWQSAQLLAREDAVRLRSDVERKRLFPERSQRYSEAANRATYHQLLQLTEQLLDQQIAVIVDAAFLRQTQRAPFIQAAQQRGLTIRIYVCEAPRELRQQRIEARLRMGQDPSDATLAVMRQQEQLCQPLTAQEAPLAVYPDQESGFA